MPALKAAYKYQTDSLAEVLGQGFGLQFLLVKAVLICHAILLSVVKDVIDGRMIGQSNALNPRDTGLYTKITPTVIIISVHGKLFLISETWLDWTE